ncbi:hypothetical protein GCM10007881_23720 [Mesorhizobium huakuii]|nr:hypothetical protein GCM10007881_23720 [Mesorhizobium huakuii]
MTNRPKSFVSILAAMGAAAALTSCSVAGSVPVVQYAQLPGTQPPALDVVRCASGLGSYSLPKSLLRVTVMKPESADAPYHTIKIEGDKRVADNRQTYCLDHLASAFADDTVRVFKEKLTGTPVAPATEATPFLQLVASNAVDQTANIVRKIIRTALILLSGNPGFAGARAGIESAGATTVVRDLRFDPFDQVEMAEINQSIVPLGFCVVLGDYSYDVDAMTIDAYCAAPESTVKRHPSRKAEIAAHQRYLIPKPTNGIFYRPRADYPVSVYVKADPGSSEHWRLGQKQYFGFENISPVISVGVDRTLFATRRTGLVFDDGVLTDVCLAKGSEAAGFVNIPLDVVYGIIALPTQTIQASVNSSATRKQLLDAQNQLVQAQKVYIDYLQDSGNSQAPKIPGATDAQALQLGTGSKPLGVPSQVAADLPARGLSGDSASIADDTVLKDVCPELVAANSGPLLARNTGVKF